MLKSVRVLDGPGVPLLGLAYAPDMMVGLRAGGAACLLSTRTGSIITDVSAPGVAAVAASAELGLGYALGPGRQVRVFDLFSGEPEPALALPEGPELVAAAMHPGGTRLAVLDAAGELLVVDLDEATTETQGAAPDATALLWSPFDDTPWPIAIRDGTAVVGSAAPHTFAHEGAALTAIALQPDTGVAATGDASGAVCLWRPTGELRGRYVHHEAPVVACCFTPAFLVTASADGRLVAWDIREA